MAMLPILKIDDGSLPNLILVVSDPDRLTSIASLLKGTKELGKNREYHSITGFYNDKQIAVVSHGVGSAGAGACFEELCRGGAKNHGESPRLFKAYKSRCHLLKYT